MIVLSVGVGVGIGIRDFCRALILPLFVLVVLIKENYVIGISNYKELFF